MSAMGEGMSNFRKKRWTLKCWCAAAGEGGKLYNPGGNNTDGPVQCDVPDGDVLRHALCMTHVCHSHSARQDVFLVEIPQILLAGTHI